MQLCEKDLSMKDGNPLGTPDTAVFGNSEDGKIYIEYSWYDNVKLQALR